MGRLRPTSRAHPTSRARPCCPLARGAATFLVDYTTTCRHSRARGNPDGAPSRRAARARAAQALTGAALTRIRFSTHTLVAPAQAGAGRRRSPSRVTRGPCSVSRCRPAAAWDYLPLSAPAPGGLTWKKPRARGGTPTRWTGSAEIPDTSLRQPSRTRHALRVVSTSPTVSQPDRPRGRYQKNPTRISVITTSTADCMR